MAKKGQVWAGARPKDPQEQNAPYVFQSQHGGMFPSMSVNVQMSMNVGMPPVMGSAAQCGGAAAQDAHWSAMGHQPSSATASGQYSPSASAGAQNLHSQVSETDCRARDVLPPLCISFFTTRDFLLCPSKHSSSNLKQENMSLFQDPVPGPILPLPPQRTDAPHQLPRLLLLLVRSAPARRVLQRHDVPSLGRALGTGKQKKAGAVFFVDVLVFARKYTHEYLTVFFQYRDVSKYYSFNASMKSTPRSPYPLKHGGISPLGSRSHANIQENGKVSTSVCG